MPNPNQPVFPNAVATDQNLLVANNGAVTQLTTPIDSVQTQFQVKDSTKFNTPCLVQIDMEIIVVGAKTDQTNTLQSCIRGFDGTSAAVHTQNAYVKGYLLAYHHNQVAAELKSIEAGLGANFSHMIQTSSQAAGDVTGSFTHLSLIPTGVTANTYGGNNTSTSLAIDAKGRITQAATSSIIANFPVFYKAAILNGNSANLSSTFDSNNSPMALPYAGPNGSLYAVASFTAAQNNWVQDHFCIPEDWSQNVVTVDVYWRTPGTQGTVIWQVQTGRLTNGDTGDFAFGSIANVVVNVPNIPYQTVKSKIVAVNMGSIAPGDEFFFKFARAANDTCPGGAELISLKFNITRNLSLNLLS